MFRLLSRPWAAESFLKACVVEFLEKPNSIAKLITYRPAIKQLYEDFRKRLPDASCGKDLRYAPQRYASESVTLLRIVMSFQSILGTLSCVPDLRGSSSEEGAACLQTLQWLNTEKCLQLAMLGDAALEVQRLVEIADQNEEDIIEFPFHVQHFRQVISKLFLEGMCLQVPCLTTVMLQQLESKKTFLLPQGRAVSLGGDMEERVKSSCLRRMSTYVALTERVLKAEFPSYEIMACFKVFSVKDMARCKQMCQNGERAQAVQKLAKVIGVNADALQHQFQHHESLAIKLCHVGGLSSFEAWKQAVQKRKSNPAELIAVLARSGGWSASSSTVERGFAHAKASAGDGKSQDENLDDEHDCVVLAQDVRPKLSSNTEKVLIGDAAAIWRSVCGRARSSGQSRQKRWDAGIPRQLAYNRMVSWGSSYENVFVNDENISLSPIPPTIVEPGHIARSGRAKRAFCKRGLQSWTRLSAQIQEQSAVFQRQSLPLTRC